MQDCHQEKEKFSQSLLVSDRFLVPEDSAVFATFFAFGFLAVLALRFFPLTTKSFNETKIRHLASPSHSVSQPTKSLRLGSPRFHAVGIATTAHITFTGFEADHQPLEP